MNNNNGHDELVDSGETDKCVSSTTTPTTTTSTTPTIKKQRLNQQSSFGAAGGAHKTARPLTMTSVAAASPQLPSSIRSLEGRRYRDILRQESISTSKENINGGIIPSGKVSPLSAPPTELKSKKKGQCIRYD